MENDNQPAAENHQTSDKQPLGASLARDEQTEPYSNPAKQRACHDKKHPLEYANFVLLFLAFLATAAAAIFTGKQSNTADDQERRSLRAYITFEDGKLNVGNPMSANIQVKNSGQTPAFGFTSWVGMRLIDAVSDTDNDNLFKFVETPAASQDIGAQGTRHLRSKEPLTLSGPDFLAVKRGRKRIVVWGVAKYRDSFQRCQFTTFRVFSDGDPAAPLLSAARGNSATDPDYECTQNPNRYQNKAKWPGDGDHWAP